MKYKGLRVATGLIDTKQNRKFAEQWIWDLYRIHHGMKPVMLQPDGTMPQLADVHQPAQIVIVSGQVPGAIQGRPLNLQAGVSADGQLVYTTVQHSESQSNVVAEQNILPAVPPNENKEVTTLQYTDVWTEYELHLAARDLDDNTRDDYKWIVPKVIADDKRTISRIDIERQLAAWKRRESHLGSTSVNLYLRNFASYCNFLCDRELLDREVNLKQFRKKGNKPKNEIYQDYEFSRVIEYFNTHVPKNGKVGPYRQVSRLLRWFLASGFRIKETLHLYRSNFNLRDRRIEVYNKRTKDTEYFPITDEILTILNELPKNQQKLFTWKYSSTSAIMRMIKAGFEAVGLKARRGFHTFRKTFADQLYQHEVDLFDRQKLLRHRDIRTTVNSYSYTENGRLGTVMEKANKKKNQAAVRAATKVDAGKNPARGSTQSRRTTARSTAPQSRRARTSTGSSRKTSKSKID
ncbi:MAG: hypothetical protein BGO89_06675 [Candidatus Kapaibacterium thiocyanatum]|uniref:Tyr recombinase domain-containing protein n=1 Tax=Candidatus Kapaibacterium thiocyanatum TaxID=1895771 RepID=A0A1M3KZ46_9BACT|nr:MAG: hypothetical protein BGO89_06675 ['Candidatus Kapabacteria' thiocyanatum]